MQSENDVFRAERVRSAHADKTKRGAQTSKRAVFAAVAGLLAVSACGGRHAPGPEMPGHHGHGEHALAHDQPGMGPCPMHEHHGDPGAATSGEGKHCPMHSLADGGVAPEHPHGHGPHPMMADAGMIPGHPHGGTAP